MSKRRSCVPGASPLGHVPSSLRQPRGTYSFPLNMYLHFSDFNCLLVSYLSLALASGLLFIFPWDSLASLSPT